MKEFNTYELFITPKQGKGLLGMHQAPKPKVKGYVPEARSTPLLH